MRRSPVRFLATIAGAGLLLASGVTAGAENTPETRAGVVESGGERGPKGETLCQA